MNSAGEDVSVGRGEERSDEWGVVDFVVWGCEGMSC